MIKRLEYTPQDLFPSLYGGINDNFHEIIQEDPVERLIFLAWRDGLDITHTFEVEVYGTQRRIVGDGDTAKRLGVRQEAFRKAIEDRWSGNPVTFGRVVYFNPHWDYVGTVTEAVQGIVGAVVQRTHDGEALEVPARALTANRGSGFLDGGDTSPTGIPRVIDEWDREHVFGVLDAISVPESRDGEGDTAGSV